MLSAFRRGEAFFIVTSAWTKLIAVPRVLPLSAIIFLIFLFMIAAKLPDKIIIPVGVQSVFILGPKGVIHSGHSPPLNLPGLSMIPGQVMSPGKPYQGSGGLMDGVSARLDDGHVSNRLPSRGPEDGNVSRPFCVPRAGDPWSRRLAPASAFVQRDCRLCQAVTRSRCRGCREALCMACARGRRACPAPTGGQPSGDDDNRYIGTPSRDHPPSREPCAGSASRLKAIAPSHLSRTIAQFAASSGANSASASADVGHGGPPANFKLVTTRIDDDHVSSRPPGEPASSSASPHSVWQVVPSVTESSAAVSTRLTTCSVPCSAAPAAVADVDVGRRHSGTTG